MNHMIETATYKQTLDPKLLKRYAFMEAGSATAIMQALHPDAFADIVEVLDTFLLTPQILLTPGGNRGCVPKVLDGSFERRGWIEARVDIYRRAYIFQGNNSQDVQDDPMGSFAEDHLVSETYQRGYAVDNVKDRIALDVEWNPKDGNLDRDFAAYRAWHSEGLIDAAVIITRIHEETRRLVDELWNQFIINNPSTHILKQPVRYDTTTTSNFEKAMPRIKRGDVGSCPILMVGIGREAWNGEQWDGKRAVYDQASNNCVNTDW